MTHEIIGSNRNLEELLDSGDLSAEELLKRIEVSETPESPIESPIVKTNPNQSYEGLLPSDATETPYGSLTETVEFYGYELVESDANIMNEFFKDHLNNKSIEEYLNKGDIKIWNKRFIKIDFSEENLSEFFNGLGYLIGLKRVYFCRNFLSVLSESVGNWKSLERANFRGNSLSFLPDSVDNWKKLRVVNFRGNSLSFLPDSVDNWRVLGYAYFEGNSLSLLPESVSNWEELIEANFTENSLNDDSKQILDKLRESTGAGIVY